MIDCLSRELLNMAQVNMAPVQMGGASFTLPLTPDCHHYLCVSLAQAAVAAAATAVEVR